MNIPGLRGLSVTEVGKRLFTEISQDDCAGQAAQLAYYFLFSLFPLLLFLVTLIGYLPIPNLFDRMMTAASLLLPPQALSLVQDTLGTVTTEQRGGLLSLGVLVALWSASAGFRAIMTSLNRAYDVEEGRPWWKFYLVSVLATVAFALLAVTAFALLVFGPQIGEGIASLAGAGDLFHTVWAIVRWPVALVLMSFVLAGVYYVAPDVEQDFRWVTPGSVIAVLGWVVASIGFSIYVQNFGNYDATYGSVGAVIVLLTWLYLTGFLLLVGGEANAVIEHLAPEGKRPGAKRQEDTGSGEPGAGERRYGERRRLHLVRRPEVAPAAPAAPEVRGTVEIHAEEATTSAGASSAIQEAGRETRRRVGLLAGVLPMWLAALAVSAFGLVVSAVAIRLGLTRIRRRAARASETGAPEAAEAEGRA